MFRSHRRPLFVVRAVLCTATLFITSLPLVGQATSFRHPDGSTHWYEAVAVAGKLDWQAAHTAAAAAGGYLATITSSAENDFVFSLVNRAAFWTSASEGPWLGGWHLGSSTEPEWAWVEIEPFGFANWAAGQPADVGGAGRIHFGGATSGYSATWASADATQKLAGYVVEFSGTTSPRTVGLQRREAGSFDGYTMFNPWRSKDTFLIDPRGRVVHRWTSAYFPGMSAYLLPNGRLLRCGDVLSTTIWGGGVGGIVEELDWSGNVTWQFRHASSDFTLHHDIELLPNGNILMIAWERKSQAEALAQGRDPQYLTLDGMWPCKIIEVQREGSGGKIVWEWHAWDHAVQDYDNKKPNHGRVDLLPERIDLNFPKDASPDWLHINAIDYNVELDQILLSVHSFSEIWVIDHSTTTAQAASHAGGKSGKGGDILYRWGNPQAHRAGPASAQQLFHQHDAQWIPASLPGASNILIFNNGLQRPGQYSSVEEIVPPKVDSSGNYTRTGATWGPTQPEWSYAASTPESFYSAFVSGAQRLPNGNTLVCSGMNGRIFEVTAAGNTVWEYTTPIASSGPVMQGDTTRENLLFRSTRYAPDYPGLKGRTLTPGDPIEQYGSAILADGSTVPRRAPLGSTVSLSLRTNYSNVGTRRHFLVATSATAGAIPIDYRFARLGVDPVLVASMTAAAPTVFQGYFGQLDALGRGSASITVPTNRALVGIDLHTAFVVIDNTARSGAGLISNTVVVNIDP